ncbi:MAG: tRNA (adenosine(37)-N6)-threonylcarbamoyltransferase complex ATPase subunit type 1 TsaE [bacterium]|nr:tRNA (adenosine(37)-N6)-threonylcarbamoyltransferase complex ATPase subunit type 1 TsaE [bacterium]
MSELIRFAADAEAQEALGRELAAALRGRGTVYLQGDLGAGKTTLTRGVLRGYGHQGSVKSPTYTLVEPYELAEVTVYHFDLYRLTDPEELELLGIRDYCRPGTLALIEWPERGQPLLPPADLVITIRPASAAVHDGRELVFAAQNELGESVLNALRAPRG